jgi:hypothetical protein
VDGAAAWISWPFIATPAPWKFGCWRAAAANSPKVRKPRFGSSAPRSCVERISPAISTPTSASSAIRVVSRSMRAFSDSSFDLWPSNEVCSSAVRSRLSAAALSFSSRMDFTSAAFWPCRLRRFLLVTAGTAAAMPTMPVSQVEGSSDVDSMCAASACDSGTTLATALKAQAASSRPTIR